MSFDIRLANQRSDLIACYPVFRALRTHLSEAEFIAQAERQIQTHSYQIAYVIPNTFPNAEPVAVAGFRIAEYLAWGKILYIDDLSTLPDARCKGYASALLDWLHQYAIDHSCAQLHLDSGVQRHDAHRLYLNKGYQITSHHFARKV